MPFLLNFPDFKYKPWQRTIIIKHFLENENKQLSLLDLSITNIGNNPHNFKIFWKASITNVEIKLNSDVAPYITVGVFKGFLSRVHKICAEKYFQSDQNESIDISNEQMCNCLIKSLINLVRVNLSSYSTLIWKPK